MNNKHKTMQSLIQFIKYALIGANNIIIDVIILNILSYTTGITSGKMLFVFNIIAFCVYSICGYNLNKVFTFKARNRTQRKNRWHKVKGIKGKHQISS